MYASSDRSANRFDQSFPGAPRNNLFDRRKFNIVNLHQLFNAAQTDSATLSLSASKSGGGIDEEAVGEFVSDAVRLEMVDPHDIALLERVFLQARETEGGSHSRL